MAQRTLRVLGFGAIVAALSLSMCATAQAQLGAGRSPEYADGGQDDALDAADEAGGQPAGRGRATEEAITLQSPAAEAAEAMILRGMKQPIKLDFQDAPLGDVVQYISDSTGLPVQLDVKALEDASIAADTPVTGHLPTVTLRSALALLLRPLDLTWVIKDETLLLTTPDKASEVLLVRVYLVHDLVSAGKANYGPLINLITSTIAPTTWDDVGGLGSVSHFGAAGALVFSQTREVHEQVSLLLAALRRARDVQQVRESPAHRLHSRHSSRPATVSQGEAQRYVVVPDAVWLVPRVHE